MAYESKVLENSEIIALRYDENVVSTSQTITLEYNRVYFIDTEGFASCEKGAYIQYVGSSTGSFTVNTATFNYNGSSAWEKLNTTPTHSTIALDNNNGVYTPASKYFNTLEEGDNGVLAGVYGKEMAYNSATTSFDGDNELFDQLTNGTKTDLNGKPIRTFHGSIPINGEIR